MSADTILTRISDTRMDYDVRRHEREIGGLRDRIGALETKVDVLATEQRTTRDHTAEQINRVLRAIEGLDDDP